MKTHRLLAAVALLPLLAACAGPRAQGAEERESRPTPGPAPAPAEAPDAASDAEPVATVADAASPYVDLETLAPGDIVHLPTGTPLTEEALYGYLAPLRVVYVGEAHDSVEDHQVQLAILKAMHARRDGRVAVGLEMLGRDVQAAADAWVAGELEERDFAAVFEESWSPGSWPFYRDLLRFARDEGIPVLALNAEDALVEAVSSQGLDGLDEGDRARLPELDLEDPWHRAAVEGIFSGHAHGGAMAERFLAVQVLWDETMAETAARFLESEAGRDRQLLVFAGGFHVRHGFGIPKRVFRRAPLPYAVVEPWHAEITEEKQAQLMDVDVPDLPTPLADVVWAVTYRAPEEARAVLGLTVAPAEGGGVAVQGVVPDGPGAAAGVREGDVLVAVDGEPVRGLADLSWIASERAPGDPGELEVRREGRTVAIPFTWGAAPSGSEHP